MMKPDRFIEKSLPANEPGTSRPRHLGDPEDMTTKIGGFQGANAGGDGSPVTPTLPFQLGPYRLEKALGRGGMGIVYSAYDQRLDRRVAIKRVLTGSDDPKRRARLRREARTTAQLTHPSIIQVFDLIEDLDGDWIVMELVAGTPLSTLLANGALDIDSALSYGRQIADGLAAAHRLGIVHRDLKTENVMVLPDGRVKILDFGIAKRLDFAADGTNEQTLSRTGEVIGTSRAMAPEQARGLEVGPRSDLFSFGVLLYEATTGVSPFRAESPVETLTRVVTHRPKPMDQLRADVPREFADLVERLLRKASELRPASAEWVANELTQLIESRRAESAVRPAAEVKDAEGTLGTTGSLGDLSFQDPSHSYDHGFGVSSWPSRTAIWATLSVVVLILVMAVAVLMPDGHDPEPQTAELAPASPAQDDPLGLYENAMQTLRRIDRPNNIESAINAFLDLLDRDPSSAAAHAGLARAYWEKSRNTSGGGDPIFLEQAMAMAQEAVRLDGYLADARTSLGLIHFSQGRYPKAVEELELAVELDPTHADAQYGLGKVADALGRSEDAEIHYRRAIQLRATPLFYDALGALLYDLGRYDGAEQAFLESLADAPDNVNALRNLGGIYYAQGRIDEAATKFQSALKIQPNASLYSNLGTIFFSRGLYTKAAAAFEDALGMDGASNQYIYWLNLGDAYRQIPGKQAEAQRSYRRALQMLDSLLKSSPDNVRLLSRRALIRARSGHRAGALADIERARQSGIGNDLYSLFRLAVAEELCGRREQALADLEEAFLSGLSLAEARFEPDLQDLRADLGFHHILVALDASSQDPG